MEALSLNLILVVDTSGSMSGGSLNEIQKKLKELAKDACGLYSFDHNLKEIVPAPKGKEEKDPLAHKKVEQGLQSLVASGGTRIQNCLIELFEKLSQAPRKYFIQVYTDAADSVNKTELQSAYDKFQTICGAIVHVILINNGSSGCGAILNEIFAVREVKATEFKEAIDDARSNFTAIHSIKALLQKDAQKVTQHEVKVFNEMITNAETKLKTWRSQYERVFAWIEKSKITTTTTIKPTSKEMEDYKKIFQKNLVAQSEAQLMLESYKDDIAKQSQSLPAFPEDTELRKSYDNFVHAVVACGTTSPLLQEAVTDIVQRVCTTNTNMESIIHAKMELLKNQEKMQAISKIRDMVLSS